MKVGVSPIAILAACSIAACSDRGSQPVPSSASPPPVSSAAATSAVKASLPDLPRADAWPLVYFEPMKITFRRAPSMVTTEPAMTEDAAARWGTQVWSMSTELKSGTTVQIFELGPKSKHDRTGWFKELRQGTIAGEVLLEERDAFIKKSRVIGKKTREGAPQLSETHIDFAACKKLGDSDYCLFVDGSVDLAMSKPGLEPDQAVDLLVVVRSLERATSRPPNAVGSASSAPNAGSPLTK